MNTDGTDFALLHEFAQRIPPDGGDDQGWFPSGLTLSGATLYGTTRFGGENGAGTIFSVNTDGTGFAVLHDLGTEFGDDVSPNGGMVVSGSMLYGTTRLGGDHGLGTIFSIRTDGTGFTSLHDFRGRIPEPTGLAVMLTGFSLLGLYAAMRHRHASTNP